MAILQLSGLFISFTLSTFCHAVRLPFSSQLYHRDASNVMGMQDAKGNALYADRNHAHPYVAFMVGDTLGFLAVDTIFGDLWVNGPLEQTSQTGPIISFSYPPINRTEANVTFSEIGFPHFNLTEQPILWSQGDRESFRFHQNGVNTTHGVLGLGPSSHSFIHQKNSSVLSPLEHWAVKDGYNNPYLTILYTPSELDWDTDFSFSGFVTYGEIVDLSKYLGISNDDLKTLKLPTLKHVETMPVVPVMNKTHAIIVDGVRVGNASLGITSNVSSIPPGKFTAQVQSANPWVTLDKTYVDVIYGSVEGATWSPSNRTYLLPCTSEIWITFTIQGHDYMIDPLSTVAPTGTPGSCIGKFVASDGSSDKYDVGLGAPFFSSVYTMYGYQNVSDNQARDPYWKFLSIIDVEESKEQFKEYRQHQSSANSPQPSINSASSTIAFPSPSSSLPSVLTVSFISTSASSSSTTAIPASESSPLVSEFPSTVTFVSGSQSSLLPSHSAEVVTVFNTVAITSTSTSTSTLVVTAASTPTSSISTIPNKVDSEKTLVGNLGTDEEDDQSMGNILSQVKYWIPSIIVGVVVLLLVVVAGIVFWAINRRDRSHGMSSAYKTLHARSAPVDVPLYGADEERSVGRYSDPYTDKE